MAVGRFRRLLARVVWHGRAVKTGRGPDLDVSFFGGSSRSVKAGRHDADDAVQIGIEPHTFVQNVRITPEGPFPKAITDENFKEQTGRMIIWMEGSAQLRFDAEELEIIRGDDQDADARRLRRAGEIVFIEPCWRNVFEDSGMLKVLPLGLGHSYIAGADAGEIVLDTDELVGLRIGQGMQECGVNNAEDRSCRTNAEGDRQDGDGGESGRLAQHAQGVANVLREVVPPKPAVGLVKALFGEQDVAEGTAGGGAGVCFA